MHNKRNVNNYNAIKALILEYCDVNNLRIDYVRLF